MTDNTMMVTSLGVVALAIFKFIGDRAAGWVKSMDEVRDEVPTLRTKIEEVETRLERMESKQDVASGGIVQILQILADRKHRP